MSAHTWRIIVEEPLPGLDNMARDAALLQAADTMETPFTALRFYRWIVPTLSLGYRQDLERAVDVEFCRDRGIDIVRRPTGGAAVLHHLELTYAVISNDRQFFPRLAIHDIYSRIAAALCEGVRRLNVPAEVIERSVPGAVARSNYLTRPTPCFSTPAQFEIAVRGRKLIGSAQKRLRRAFLQHGSIPYDFDWELLAGAMRVQVDELRTAVAGLAGFLSPFPGNKVVLEALLQGFADTFQAKFSLEPFPSELQPLATELAPRYHIRY